HPWKGDRAVQRLSCARCPIAAQLSCCRASSMPQAPAFSVLSCYGSLSHERAAPGKLLSTPASTPWESTLHRSQDVFSQSTVCQYERKSSQCETGPGVATRRYLQSERLVAVALVSLATPLGVTPPAQARRRRA